MQAKRNLAHRMGRWSGTHPKTAIFGWIAFVLIAFFLGNAIGTKTLEDSDRGVGESGRADRTLADNGFAEPASESVLVQARDGKLTDSEYAAISADWQRTLSAIPEVAEVTEPKRAEDGVSALLGVELSGDAADGLAKYDAVTAAIDQVRAANPELTIDQAGGITFEKAIDDKLASDFAKAEQLSIPITLVILVVAFGAFIAAGLPVALGLTSVFSAIGLLAVTSQVQPVSDSASIVMMLLGM